MRLNYDCIRAVLFCIESNQTMEHGQIKEITSGQIVNQLNSSFDSNDILYSLKQLNESGYLKSSIFKTSNYGCIVIDITPRGHELINNIRDEKVWSKTKEVVNKTQSVSLNIISSIANSMISAVVEATIKSMTGV